MIKKNFLLLSLTSFVYLSFFLGYFLQENSAGGGAIDFNHITNNILLFKQNNFLGIDWSKYESTSLPIYYLIIKILNISNFFTIGLFNMFISLSIVLIFFKILSNISRKYSLKTDSVVLFSISSLPLLSPYFRTSTFWMLEENIGYLFMLSSILFWTRKKTYMNIFLCIIFSSLAFYSRQSYAFICIIIFFSLIDFKKIFSYKNYYISFVFFFTLFPSIYFFFEWQGLIPPYAATDRSISFRFVNLLIIFSISLFYLIPFFVIEEKSIIKDFFKKNYKMLVLIFIFFSLFFFNEIQLDDDYYKFKLGGGIIYKLVFHLNFLFENFLLKKVIFLILSYIGLILIVYFSLKTFELKLFFLIFILIFSNANIIFQEYFDPMIFFLVIIFYKMNDLRCNLINLYLILFCYNLTLLISNLVYYNILISL
tara:strand:+ start:2327 stop:3598 length:1272 start_codon:yes stop_codon:yes gene_type:complete